MRLIAAPTRISLRLMPMESAAPRLARRSLGLAVASLLLVLAGVAGYFVVVFRAAAWLPSVRNDAVPNWILVALGVGLAALAMRRAPAARTPKVLLGVNVALAGLFAAILYAVPILPAAMGPMLGAPAADFALLDQAGKTVRLADLRGAPVLLVFYRGHW